MRFKVIIFCALLLCSKFVASTPFGNEELLRQRAYHSNNWQGNQNAAEQYHGSGFARTQNTNSMNNFAHQTENAHEYTSGPGRQHYENYAYNNAPPSLQPLPVKESQVNFAHTNERRSEGFPPRHDAHPIGTGNRPTTLNNQYRQRNWQNQNRFINSAPSATGGTATGHERPLVIAKEPYYAPGQQHMQISRPANHQHQQADSSYSVVRDHHYHPIVEKPGNIRYMDHSVSRPGNVRYENYNEAHAHGTSASSSGRDGYVENSPPRTGPQNIEHVPIYNGPSVIKTDTLKHVGSNPARPGLTSNNGGSMYNDGRVIHINSGSNNENTRYADNPIIPSGPNNHVPNAYVIPVAPANPRTDNTDNRYVGNPASNSESDRFAASNTYSNGETPVIITGPDNLVPNNYNAPAAPANTVTLDEAEISKLVENPVVIPQLSNFAPENRFYLVPESSSNEAAKPPPANDYNEAPIAPLDAPDNRDMPEPINLHTLEDTNPYPNVVHVSNQAKLQKYMNEIKKNFVLIHANGTVEYIHNLKTRDSPNYIVRKKDNNGNYYTVPTSPSQPPQSSPAEPEPAVPRNNTENEPSQASPGNADNPSVESQPSPGTQPSNNNDYNSSSQSQTQSGNDYHSQSGSAVSDSKYHQPPSGPQIHNNHYFNSFSAPHFSHAPRRPHYHPHHRGINNSTHPSKLHTHIRTSSTSTTEAPDYERLQKFFDSIDNEHEDNASSTPFSNDNDFHHTTTTAAPTTTTTTESPGDLFIETFLESLSHQSNNGRSESDQDEQIPPSENNYNTTPVPLFADSKSPLGFLTTSPVENTTQDQIITLSPIELATDNVKDGSTPSPIDVGAPDYQNDDVLAQIVTTTSPSNIPVQQQNDDSADEVLKTYTNSNKNSNDTILEDNEKSNRNTACIDSLTNTDVPAKPDDNSAAATNSTNQSGVNSSDSTGDNLLEIQPPTNQLNITLSIPNGSDGNISITIQVPDGTGEDDASGDDTLILTIATKNSSDTHNGTPTKYTADKNNTSFEGYELNKNMMLDLSNALVVLNRTTDKDYLNQILSSNSPLNMFVFQMPCQDQVLVERNKETTIYPNGTCVEETKETTWKNKDDPSPTTIFTKKINSGGNCH